MRKTFLAVLVVVALAFTSMVRAGTSEDEKAIKALNDVFAEGFVKRDAKLRASIWTKDGTVAPPTGGFFEGREAIEKDFAQEIPSVTDSSRMSFSNYRFRFITKDVAFVDADITINNVMGPDGKVHPVVPVSIVFSAVRQDGKWFIQDERAHFAAAPPPA